MTYLQQNARPAASESGNFFIKLNYLGYVLKQSFLALFMCAKKIYRSMYIFKRHSCRERTCCLSFDENQLPRQVEYAHGDRSSGMR